MNPYIAETVISILNKRGSETLSVGVRSGDDPVNEKGTVSFGDAGRDYDFCVVVEMLSANETEIWPSQQLECKLESAFIHDWTTTHHKEVLRQ